VFYLKRKAINIPFQIVIADSFFKRFKGLMFRKEPLKNEGLWIIPCNAVHMFFMNFQIDVIFLNEQNQVVKAYQSLKPWRITKPIKTAFSTLELPAGSIQKLGIKVGQTVKCSN
jgi:uncharacterized membrane protein (UPF0127 family)